MIGIEVLRRQLYTAICLRAEVYLLLRRLSNTNIWIGLWFMFQVQSEFILESERESFIEQIREVIENADEKGLERDTNSQVKTTQITSVVLVRVFLYCLNELYSEHYK